MQIIGWPSLGKRKLASSVFRRAPRLFPAEWSYQETRRNLIYLGGLHHPYLLLILFPHHGYFHGQ